MADHSPEPWRLTNMGFVDADDVLVGGLRGECDDAFPMSLHDQCRIIACVNACAGIPTEELERRANEPR